MPYLDTVDRSLGVQLDDAPSSDLVIVIGYAKIVYVGDRPKTFYPRPKLITLSDDTLQTLLDAPAASEIVKLTKLDMYASVPEVTGIGFSYIDGSDEYLFNHFFLSPGDNLGYGKRGWYCLNSCASLKTTNAVCDDGTLTGGYASDFGDDTSTEFEFTHDLGTRDLIWAIRTTEEPCFYANADVFASTPSTVTVSGYAEPPGDSEYRVILKAADFAQSVGLGDDSTTSFVVNHNLGTRDVAVRIWQAGSPYLNMVADVYRTDNNNVTVVFSVPPELNEFRVCVGLCGSSAPGGFGTDFGDGAETTFDIEHNLFNLDLISQIWDLSAPYQDIGAEIMLLDDNTAEIGPFAVAPVTNQYRYITVGV